MHPYGAWWVFTIYLASIKKKKKKCVMDILKKRTLFELRSKVVKTLIRKFYFWALIILHPTVFIVLYLFTSFVKFWHSWKCEYITLKKYKHCKTIISHFFLLAHTIWAYWELSLTLKCCNAIALLIVSTTHNPKT